MDIKNILRGLGYTPLDTQEDDVDTWQQLYEGNLKKFHRYQEYLGAKMGSVTRKRKSMKMAKMVSELWADNIINPETTFTVNDWWDEYVEEYDLYSSLNDLMELTFALGTGFTVQNKEKDGQVINQYITVKNAIPLKIKYGKIKDIAFVSETSEGFYIQVHLEEGESYLIKNHLFDKKGKELQEDDIEKEFKSDVKLWQMYKPAIVNNINFGNPLGISIYANAIEELKSVDIAMTSLDQEVRNGRMRVYIRGQALIYDEGTEQLIFDKEQDEFYLLPEDDTNPDNTFITIQAPTLRVDSFINNLEKQLNLLGTKCGLGDNAFYSQDGTIYTNTAQVVSTNSKFYKTRQKHITRIENSLKEMIHAIYYLEKSKELTDEIFIDFDDSIIHDKEADQNRVMQLYNAGIVSEVYVMQVMKGMTEEEATEFIENQKELKGNEEEPDIEEEW